MATQNGNINIEYYSEHIHNINDYIQANGEKVIVFQNGNSGMFVHAAQVRYKNTIAERAPIYRGLERSRKTNYSLEFVNEFIANGYIFVQCDKNRDNKYFVYDMDNSYVREKIVRVKIAQGMRDFNRASIAEEENGVAVSTEGGGMSQNPSKTVQKISKKKKTGSKSKVAHKARSSPIKKNAYRKKKDAGHSFRSDGINVEDFVTKEDSLLDDIIKNYEPVIREPSEEEKQLWKEAVRDIPEINTDHITYNPDTYKEDIAKDKVEMKSIFLKALREDDTVLQPLYEDVKHDSVLTYENYIHKYEVPDEEMMEILDGPDFTSINVELNLRFDQLQTFLEFHLSEAAAKHENDSALEPLEDPVLNEDVWDQVIFDNVENK